MEMQLRGVEAQVKGQNQVMVRLLKEMKKKDCKEKRRRRRMQGRRGWQLKPVMVTSWRLTVAVAVVMINIVIIIWLAFGQILIPFLGFCQCGQGTDPFKNIKLPESPMLHYLPLKSTFHLLQSLHLVLSWSWEILKWFCCYCLTTIAMRNLH